MNSTTKVINISVGNIVKIVIQDEHVFIGTGKVRVSTTR